MTDTAPKTTHAQRRRMEAREGVRLKLRSAQFIRRLHEIAVKADAPDANVPALRLQADIYTRLLAKCLPDLRAIEYTGGRVQRPVTELSDAELMAIISAPEEGERSAAGTGAAKLNNGHKFSEESA